MSAPQTLEGVVLQLATVVSDLLDRVDVLEHRLIPLLSVDGTGVDLVEAAAKRKARREAAEKARLEREAAVAAEERAREQAKLAKKRAHLDAKSFSRLAR